jgi:flotillin
VGEAEAVRERTIKVAQNIAESEKGKKQAEADRRVYVQQQETQATVGEAEATREKDIRVAENVAASAKGQKKAEADRRVYVQQQEAEAVKGENIAQASIADYNAELAAKQAAALQKGEVAKRHAEAEIQKAQYLAEEQRLNAEEVVRQEVDKRKIEIAAEAEAERVRREAKGTADGILFKYQAEAEGIRKVLDSKAAGYRALVESCGGNAKSAATLLMIEKIEEIVAKQVEAISNLKIDKITVWDSGGEKGSSTAGFVSGLIKTLPPLHEIAKMAGVELPDYLGTTTEPKLNDDKEKPVR